VYLPLVFKGYLPPPRFVFEEVEIPFDYGCYLAVSGKTLIALGFVEGWEEKAFVSPDEGESWKETNFHEVEGGGYEIFISPTFQVDKTVIVIGRFLKISTDGGFSWQFIKSGIPEDNPDIKNVTFSPNFASDGRVWLLTWGYGRPVQYICISENGGRTWEVISSREEEKLEQILALSPTTLIGTIYRSWDVLISYDKGRSFSRTGEKMLHFKRKGDRIFGWWRGELFWSPDGIEWKKYQPEFPEGYSLYGGNYAISDDGFLFCDLERRESEFVHPHFLFLDYGGGEWLKLIELSEHFPDIRAGESVFIEDISLLRGRRR
jgi:hypothetical protein